jgi:multimeric flavodoxin WrbA
MLLKPALEAVKAAATPPDSTIGPVRIPDVSVPEHSLNASNILPKDKDAFNAPAYDASIIDSRPFVLDLILDAGAIILCCPIYTRVIPGSVKLFQDKTLGPFVDSVMARHQKEGVVAQFEKKRVAGLMAVGGAWAASGRALGCRLCIRCSFCCV